MKRLTTSDITSFANRLIPAALLVALSCILTLAPAHAAFVIAPDNGSGTATMPPAGEDYVGVLMQIVDGLPAGTTVDMPAPLFGSFSSVLEAAGGSFVGGTTSAYDAVLTLPMTGTGTLLGYVRTVNVPLTGLGSQKMDFDARISNTSPQSFDGDLRRMQGQITGDPDFDLLRITAGSEFGMPSPGHTTLTDVGGGNWNVDSFFDITYRIDFVGAPGSQFAGRSGSTTGTTRFQMGMRIPEPASVAMLAVGVVAMGVIGWKRNRRD